MLQAEVFCLLMERLNQNLIALSKRLKPKREITSSFFLIRERRPYFLNLDAAICLRFVLGKIREMKIEETLNIVRKNKFE